MDKTIAAIPDNFESIRYRAIELMVLLSRAAVSETTCGAPPLETNNLYLQRLQESMSTEELIRNLQLAAERLAEKIFSFRGIRHVSVLRKAERYIWENYTRKISLEEIAKASGLSAPYFSSIFKEEMGENFSVYLNRLRVEKAATLLVETGRSLKEISGLCGFEDQSWFSKIFRSFTGLSPGKYREHGGRHSLRSGKKYVKNEMNFPDQPARSEKELVIMSS
jgi:YesN/AraC family two-component response regulator